MLFIFILLCRGYTVVSAYVNGQIGVVPIFIDQRKLPDRSRLKLAPQSYCHSAGLLTLIEFQT